MPSQYPQHRIPLGINKLFYVNYYHALNTTDIEKGQQSCPLGRVLPGVLGDTNKQCLCGIKQSSLNSTYLRKKKSMG